MLTSAGNIFGTGSVVVYIRCPINDFSFTDDWCLSRFWFNENLDRGFASDTKWLDWKPFQK